MSGRNVHGILRRVFAFFVLSMEILTELGVILGLVVGISVVMQAFRLPLLLGYLLAGFLAGPGMWGLFHSNHQFELFSQLGITALLFIVGLGLNPAVIRETGKTSLYTGLGQTMITSVMGTASPDSSMGCAYGRF